MKANRREFIGSALMAGVLAGCRGVEGVGASEIRKPRFEKMRIKGLEPRPDFWKVRPDEIIDVCARANKCARKEIICRTPLGYPVYALFYGDGFDDTPPQTNWPAGRSSNSYHSYYGHPEDGRQTFLFIAGIHGAEPECVASAVNLIQMLETGKDFRGKTDEKLLKLISRYRLIIVPCVNMDGRAICPDHLRGIDWDTFRRASQGVWKADGSRIGWYGSKAWFPLPLDQVTFPGGYPNSDGYNINLDCVPGDVRTAEANALLKLAARWRVDCILNGHSCETSDGVIRPSAVDSPARLARHAELRYRCNHALFEAGWANGKPDLPGVDKRPLEPFVCIDNALAMACGAIVLCLECTVSYDQPDLPPRRKPKRLYSFDELMQPAFVVIRAALEAGLEQPFFRRGDEGVLED